MLAISAAQSIHKGEVPMRDTGLSKARRAWISTLLVGATLVAGYLCVRHWPATTVTIDPIKTPFYGPYQANGFIHRTIDDTQGLRRAHKLIVGATLLVALLGSFRWWKTDLVRWAWGLIKALLAERRRVRRNIGGLVIMVLLAVLLAKEMPSLRKTPDFTNCTLRIMSSMNMHISMTLGHADRLAAGDVLFRQTTPVYGVLVPVLLGIYERQFGLITLGDHVRGLIGVEVLYWMIAGYLFLIWSRRHWLSCLLPGVLLLEYFWSTSLGLIPPNHSPYRSAGLTFAVLNLIVLRRASPRTNQWAAGIVSGLAVLANLESGIAATAGLVIYVYRRYALVDLNERRGGLPRMAGRFSAGFLLTLIGFVLLCRIGCGSWPFLPGLSQHFVYARLSSAGFGTRPFRFELYDSAYFAFWPLTMVAHTAWSVWYTAQQRSGGFRPSFRIAVGSMLLVWFAYFANRPDPEYLSSYVLLYGLLLIDLGRYIGLAFKRPRSFFGIQAILAALVLCHAGYMASRVTEWSWNPSQWTVKCFRFGMPLVGRDKVRTKSQPRISKAYLPKTYADSLQDRAAYLRRVAGGHRLVYFTVDSYLMPRLSGVLPLQQYTDPVEAFTKPAYDRLLSSVLKAPVNEVYVDSRDAADLIWYGRMFDLLRRDLSRRFQCDGIEHGWEIWRRRPVILGKRGESSDRTR